jgi:hypothetical protein
MTSQTSVLIAGVDTLIINARYPSLDHLDEPQKKERAATQDAHVTQLLEQVKQWADVAKVSGEEQITPLEHEHVTLKVHPNGTRTHRYLLKNGLIDLLLGPQLNNSAPIRVRFSSEYLWKRGVDAALMNTHLFLSGLFKEIVDIQPAEIHLCVDVAGFQIPRNYEQVFVTRAAKWRPIKEAFLDRPVYRHHKLETLQFSGHGNPLSVSIYDKRAEIEQHSQEKRWFYHLWKEQQWDGKTPVWRVECRVKREALHEMDMEEGYQAIALVPSLWAYCVGRSGHKDGWLRMVAPNIHDSNRRRWKTAGDWETVQRGFAAKWRDGADIEDIQRTRKREVNLDRAEKAIAGYTTTYAAWLQDALGPDDDASIVLQRLYGRMLDIWEEKGADFQTLRKMKEYLYNIS